MVVSILPTKRYSPLAGDLRATQFLLERVWAFSNIPNRKSPGEFGCLQALGIDSLGSMFRLRALDQPQNNDQATVED